jgi:hypothetical protein
MMAWYDYLALFFAGLFAANGVPHFVQGICGNRFQTPFASPPAVGESSAAVNVIWGWFNFAVAGALAHYFLPQLGALVPWAACAAAGIGALVIALWLSQHFAKVRRAPPAP